MITSNGDWVEEDEVFTKCLTKSVHEYAQYCEDIATGFEVTWHEFFDTGIKFKDMNQMREDIGGTMMITFFKVKNRDI